MMQAAVETQITSVRKSRQEYLKERLEKKGISTHLSEIRLPFSRDESFSKLWKKTIQALRKPFTTMDISEDVLGEVSFGRLMVNFERMERTGSLRKAFDLYQELSKTSSEVVREGAVEIHIIGGCDFREFGYSVLNSRLPDTKHNKSWYYKSNKKDAYTLYDIPTLLAEILLRNSLWVFARKHADFVRHRLARQLVKSFGKAGHFRFHAPSPKWLPLLNEMNEMMPGISTRCNTERPLSDYVHEMVWDAISGDLNALNSINAEKNRSKLHDLFEATLFPFLEEIGNLQDDADAREESIASHARVWQLKKNIPNKTLSRMKDNAFLMKYGSVDLDADVDLERFGELEAEFRRLCTMVPIPEDKTHSFRIRKLGNYRADGVYFMHHRATCIDLDGVGSYVHECGHQFDMTLLGDGKRLSEQSDFLSLYYSYEKSVIDAITRLPADDPLRGQWFGKSKYNSAYFLRPTEVFARSFELYLSEVKGIRSSFLKPDYHRAVYPTNQNYITVVEKYFSRRLPVSVPEEVAAPTPTDVPQNAGDTFPHIEFSFHPVTGQLIMSI